MAKVISPFKLRGSIGDLTYYENEFGPQVKGKGGPTEWQVKNLKQFVNTRYNAAEFKRATAASRLLRQGLGSLRHSVKNMRLSGRMIGQMLAALKEDRVHGKGERLVDCGDLSLLAGFEFNHKLSLEDALPLSIANHVAVEPGKVAVNIPAFQLRKKKTLPEDATHYRLVSCILSIDFEKRTFQQDKRVGNLQAMGRKAGAPFCAEQVVQPDNEQGCFWLMGIEFYKMVKDKPVLVKGGALRVMEWIGKAGGNEPVTVVQDVADEVLTEGCDGKDEPIEAVMEEIGAAYREVMEELLAASWERSLLAEADTDIAADEQSAAIPESDVVGVEVKATSHMKPIANEVNAALVIDEDEFEKSLWVLLPVERDRRRAVPTNSIQPVGTVVKNDLLEQRSYEPAL